VGVVHGLRQVDHEEQVPLHPAPHRPPTRPAAQLLPLRSSHEKNTNTNTNKLKKTDKCKYLKTQ
jgi:hypothetical protein